MLTPPRSADLQYWIWSWHEKLHVHLQDVIRTAQTIDVRVKAGKKSTPEETALRLQVVLLREIMPCLSTVPTEKTIADDDPGAPAHAKAMAAH